MNNAYLIEFEKYTDERGSLISFEYNKNCPFEIKRCFFIYDVPSVISRGGHTNTKSKNILVAVNGSCKIKVVSNSEQKTFILDRPNVGLFIDKNVYREMFEFDDNCILLCISDKKYNKQEYIKG